MVSVGRLLKSWDSDDDFLPLVESEHSAGGRISRDGKSSVQM